MLFARAGRAGARGSEGQEFLRMSEFVRVCAASQLPRVNEVAEVTVQGRALCVANVDGSITVVDGVCPHEGGPLGEGLIEEGRVVCPWHGYSFDLRTGACFEDDTMKTEVLESRVEDGELKVKL
jgi:nitrite reductase (NADH) small subunit